MSLIHLYMIHVSYASIYESCLLHIYIWVLSRIHLYMSPVFYTSIYELCFLYIYIRVKSLIHLYMSRVSYTSIYESCLRYIYIWVMSLSLALPDWFDPRGILSVASVCPRTGSTPEGSFPASVSPLPTTGSIPVCHHSETWPWLIAMPSMREPNQIKCFLCDSCPS